MAVFAVLLAGAFGTVAGLSALFLGFTVLQAFVIYALATYAGFGSALGLAWLRCHLLAWLAPSAA